MLGVTEDVARGLIDGHRAGVGRRVGVLLAHVQLQGVEAEGVLGVVHVSGHDGSPLVWKRRVSLIKKKAGGLPATLLKLGDSKRA